MELRSKIMRLVAITLSVSPVCIFGRNSEPQTLDEQPVLRLEQDWLKALTERDRVSLNRILADEFVDCSWHGELRTKRQILAELGERAAYPQRLDDLKVSRYQQTAIVRGTNIVTDQTGRVLTRIRFTDVFIYRGGHWQAVAAQETEIKT